MSEDAGAAAGTAEGTETGTTAAQGTEPSGTPAPTPGTADRSAEEMLADAAEAGDEDDQDDDAAKALAKAQAEAKKWRDLSRQNERKWKDAAPSLAKLAEIEDSNKSEVQRATDRAALAEQRASEAESLYHRTLAAAQYSVPPSLIDRITGSTEEECAASAEALAAAINEAAAIQAAAAAKLSGGQPSQPQRAASRPVESLRPGAAPAGTPDPSDPNAWIRAQLGRQ